MCYPQTYEQLDTAADIESLRQVCDGCPDDVNDFALCQSLSEGKLSSCLDDHQEIGTRNNLQKGRRQTEMERERERELVENVETVIVLGNAFIRERPGTR
jgi:hypothetical protein